MIWVIGGAGGTHNLCEFLREQHKTYQLTIMTDYKRDAGLSYSSHVLSHVYSEEEIVAYLKAYQVELVIDHSYEQLIYFSKRLMKQCEAMGIPYIRYTKEEKVIGDTLFATEVNALGPMVEAISHRKKGEIEEVMQVLLWVNRSLLSDLTEILKEYALWIYAMDTPLMHRRCEQLIVEPHRIVYEENEEENAILQRFLAHQKIDLIIVGEKEVEKLQRVKSVDIPLLIVKKSFKYTQEVKTLEALKGYMNK